MPVRQTETTITAEGPSRVVVRITAVTPHGPTQDGIVGFAATVEFADPDVVPFIAGDLVFGVTGGQGIAVGSQVSLEAEHICGRPRSIPSDIAARLARNAVIAWLALFERLAMETATDNELALVEAGDEQLGLLLVRLLQRLTKVDVIVGAGDVGPWRSVLRPDRDEFAPDCEALVAILKKEARTPRYLVLAGDPRSRVFDLNDIVSLFQQGIGAVRVLDLAWISNVGWLTVARSRFAISDILAELKPIFETEAQALFELCPQTT
ncbi:hypothetical protein GGE16_001620 [Rhizobium leguminosarum]|uniref:Uncharacterized protein n=1 Tax=Rhizobium leguminosarum TaxID=384 RepID=A0AAE2MHT0_RHILE|nr:MULTISPECIES: hypothetical protein [Rhizobium]MBB4289580.1 hypothetical protein [Rhizobium leguminosarum]MBB4296224.1 hypothetical protein [Rhizobium leguminosarum]MBB4308516.1 hypothetical protein [Rhizobium leguminosarum]MBB4416352.1 hypothetical protein [Rhizobium leguminosarum]MBB4430681.1 hypothetical protein [Rhizobium esperanzae]